MYRETGLAVERSLRSALRAVAEGAGVDSHVRDMLEAVRGLERIAVSVDLEEPVACLAVIVDEYRSRAIGDTEFVDRFVESYEKLETAMDAKRASISRSFYALIAALAASLMVSIVVGAGLSLRLRMSRAETEWSQKSLLGVLSAEERLRKRIANDLHDDVAQDIAAAKMLCERSMPAPSAGLAAEAAGLLASAGRTIRGIAMDLRPPELERSGLAAALEASCARSRDALGRRTVCHIGKGVDGAVRALGEEAAIQAYRIVQEAVANARKHADGNLVEVTARVAQEAGTDGVVICVTDRPDGTGSGPGGAARVPPDDSVSSGLGLSIMRERASIAGGSLSARAEGAGFQVRLFLPVPGTEGEAR